MTRKQRTSQYRQSRMFTHGEDGPLWSHVEAAIPYNAECEYCYLGQPHSPEDHARSLRRRQEIIDTGRQIMEDNYAHMTEAEFRRSRHTWGMDED